VKTSVVSRRGTAASTTLALVPGGPEMLIILAVLAIPIAIVLLVIRAIGPRRDGS